MSDSSTPSSAFHGPLSETEVLDVFGVHIRVLMPAGVTGGALSMFEDHNDPGAGPPLHVHHDADEIFAVVTGSYRFMCNQNVMTASAGDVVLVPRGAPHTFLN
ncbi:MAG: cupin domain-containing protein, partial [Deltaproteobacteria bacterium]